MSDGNRGDGSKALAAFFGLLAILGVVWVFYALGAVSGQQEGRSIEAATSHKVYGKQQAIEACLSEPITRRTECVYDTATATEDAKRAEQDLQAQQGMHFWAVFMVFVGLLQAGVASGALWFLREDLRQNRRSAEQQLRAYLTLEPYGVTAVDEYGQSQLPIEVHNLGQTPSYSLSVSHGFAIREDPQNFDPSLFVGPLQESRIDSCVGPTKPALAFAFFDGKTLVDYIEDFRNKRRALIHFGRITYRDAFSVERQTCFAFFHWGAELNRENVRRCSKGNNAT